MSVYIDKFNKLPKYSFILNKAAGGVIRVNDSCGNWIDKAHTALIIEEMDDEITHLRSVILALKGRGLSVVPS